MGLRSYVDELATQLANVEWAQRTRESRMKWVIVLELELLVVMIGTAALLSRVSDAGIRDRDIWASIGIVACYVVVFLWMLVGNPVRAVRWGLHGATLGIPLTAVLALFVMHL